MAATRGTIAQLNPAATTETTLYTVASATDFVGSLWISELGNAAATVRVRIRVNAEADNAKQFIAHDLPVAANETVILRGIVMGDTDIIEVEASTANVAFSLIGQLNS